MRISARNQLKGTVTAVQRGAVNGIVTLDCAGTTIKASITNDAIEDLGLAEGKEAYAIVKASSVIFATDKVAGISARNQIRGTISKVTEGAVNGIVVIDLPQGGQVKGSITNEAIEDLGLAEGKEAVAIIKANEVMVGVE